MKRDGFTLVEILVVIALVATISVILGTNLMKIIGNSEAFEEKELAKDIEDAAYVYVAEENKSLPTACTSVSDLIIGGYLDDEKGLMKNYDSTALSGYYFKVDKVDNEKIAQAYKKSSCTDGEELGE